MADRYSLIADAVQRVQSPTHDDLAGMPAAQEFLSFLQTWQPAPEPIGRMAAPYDVDADLRALAKHEAGACARECYAGHMDDGTPIPLNFN
jgi:hypothetical protein